MNNRIVLIKNLMLVSLVTVFLGCHRNSFSPINIIQTSVVESIASSNQTDEDRKKMTRVFDAIDDYIANQEQIVLETKPHKAYTVHIPDSLLDELNQGDLWSINMYYLGELLSTKQKILFEDAVYGYSEYSPHGSQKLLIYDDNNILLGYYPMSIMEIPKIVSDNSISLKSADSDCNQSTILNLHNGIPSEIFIKCNKEGGDICSFVEIKNQ